MASAGIQYSAVIKGLIDLRDETVIDGEVIAFDEEGRPSFNALQNYGSSRTSVVYFVFDLMMLRGEDVMHLPLTHRQTLLDPTCRLLRPVVRSGRCGTDSRIPGSARFDDRSST